MKPHILIIILTHYNFTIFNLSHLPRKPVWKLKSKSFKAYIYQLSCKDKISQFMLSQSSCINILKIMSSAQLLLIQPSFMLYIMCFVKYKLKETVQELSYLSSLNVFERITPVPSVFTSHPGTDETASSAFFSLLISLPKKDANFSSPTIYHEFKNDILQSKQN